MNDKSGGDYYGGDSEVEDVVRRFESGELPPSEFKHIPHLTVSLFYLLRFPEQEALRRMRQSIHSYLLRHNIDPRVYHETLTVFWMRRVSAFVAQSDTSRPLAQLANELIASCRDKEILFEYYSRELINSEEAHARWVKPDVKPLDF